MTTRLPGRGVSVTVVPVSGPSGAKGDVGDTGPKGDTGDTGADSTVAGPRGIQGVQGERGEQGSKGDTGADSTVAGPQGETGLKGDQGIQGNIGPRGDKGLKGDTGADSIVAGPKGNTGDTGLKGSTGDPGVVQAIVAGDNITIDNGDPANPKVSAELTEPAGSNTQVQFNDSGVFAGNSGFVYKNGNVGIGTDNPANMLHLRDLAATILLQTIGNNSGEHEIRFGFGGDMQYAASIVGRAIGRNSKGNIELRVTDVNSHNATSSDTGIRVTGTDVQILKPLVYAQDVLQIGKNNNSGTKAFRFTGSENKAAIWSVPTGSFGGGDLRFTAGNMHSGTALTAADAVMRIASGGGVTIGNDYLSANPTDGILLVKNNVGVGTTNPTEKLDVSGTVKASGYKSSDGSEGASGSFTSQDGKTVTVKNGLITGIV